jgi:hypothetical protein
MSTSDQLPTSIPFLDAGGDNWHTFSIRFGNALRAKKLWGHFDGTALRPEPKPVIPTLPLNVEHDEAALAEHKRHVQQAIRVAREDETFLAALEKWEEEENLAAYLLTQRISDTLLVVIESLSTVTEKWTRIYEEYSFKSLHSKTSMLNSFLESRVLKGGSIRDFLIQLREKRERLVQAGITLSDNDYRSTIIRALPTELAKFASMQLTALEMSTRQMLILTNDSRRHDTYTVEPRGRNGPDPRFPELPRSVRAQTAPENPDPQGFRSGLVETAPEVTDPG